jgi:ubiquinone/menaquinone biosynthesis C-methylase UbiE
MSPHRRITGRVGTDAEAFKAFEGEGWSVRAETYGGLIGAITRRLAEALLDAADVGPGQRVLDVATGPGYVAERAAARGARPVGLDLARGMLELARRRVGGVEFVLGDAERLPFEDACFDAVVGGCVINHLPRPQRALREAARVLAPGGAMAFSAWDRPERMRVIGVVTDAIEAAGVEAGDAVPAGGPDPYRFADEAQFSALLEEVGLHRVAVATVELTHRAAGTEELWRGFLGSSVRSAAVIGAQDAGARRRIREALDQAVRPYQGRDGELELPVAAKLGSGRKR